ncbi:galactosylceramide sulfotransferase-like [Anneissia japonica]|uniref:galactosylceramide sulfotransferase-like n=1 Tax=Anneissia japonica TaxID=1529436 RepID=UPI00142583AD|nr:galactosylceramide sulfotransferase-like [Anneissia japonica]XP_033116567.1 galactosylceramide sulfotransferase-like [Anneissia japonica]
MAMRTMFVHQSKDTIFTTLLLVCFISLLCLLSLQNTVQSSNKQKEDLSVDALSWKHFNHRVKERHFAETFFAPSEEKTEIRHTVHPTVKRDNCTMVDHIVFVKTHKTASTTLASILQRFGFTRNLTFTLGKRGHILSSVNLFQRSMIPALPQKSKLFDKPLNGYHLLTNHVRYNRPEMDAVVRNAKYITIIREPAAHFESTFGYFEMAKRLKLTNHSNPIEVFMKNPSKFLAKKFYMWQRAKNGQLYDLGLEHQVHNDLYHVQYKIRQLDSEFDLVLLSEYFDESLILLKKLMCWSFDDILYVSNGIRSSSHRYDLNDQLRARIRKWNSADVMMYNHFNKTLWRKIKEYGDGFKSDLAEFRFRERAAMQKCIDEQRLNRSDRREEKFVLKRNVTGSIFCENILRGDIQYTKLIRNFMQSQGLHPTSPPIKDNVPRQKASRSILKNPPQNNANILPKKVNKTNGHN